MPIGLPLALLRPAREDNDGRGARTPALPRPASPARNWIAVASADHARRGRDHRPLGFMQVCHGKAGPLRRISAGDRVAYYAPASTMGGRDRLQQFISIGLVQPGKPYAVDMGGGFVPWRRDVRYVRSEESPITPLIPELDFIDDPRHWGARFRFGLVAVNDEDMRRIAEAMRADMSDLGL